MVCAAVLVMKSELLVPVSGLKPKPLNVVVGRTLSTVAFVVSEVVVLLPALSVALTDTLRLATLLIAPATMV